MKTKLQLQLFAFEPGVTPGTQSVNPVNVTGQASMNPTMKTFYDTSLLENARENMVFTQLGKKQPMKGNKVEFRRFKTFAKALAPLTEGVVPTGQTFGMEMLEAKTTQHGDYVSVSDRLELESYDDVIYGATEEMGAAEGETYDTLTRNVLVGGNSVAYCPSVADDGSETEITARGELDSTCILTPKMVAKAVTWLKKNKAPKIDGYYACVLHPSVAYDLRNSDEWKEFHKYADVAPIFNGEIGTLHGCRFIESNNTKVYKVNPLTEASTNLTVAETVAGSATIKVKEAITEDEARKLATVVVTIGGLDYTIEKAVAGDAGKASITLVDSITADANATIAPSGGAKDGGAAYGVLFMGRDAFGVLDPQGEGMEMIIKDRSQIGGPLNQYSTIGYKFCHGAKILYQERMLRVECGSTYSDVDEAN